METEQDKRHREQTATKLSPEGRRYFQFIEFDAEEELITEIRKHSVGLIIVLLTGAFVIVALLAASIFLGVADFDSALAVTNANTFRPLLVLVMFVMIIATAIMTFIAAFLYQSNVIFITSEKIAQVVYRSLFNRKISQLSIGDVQDVTVTQKGLLAHFFNYGTLVIETAGEQENYQFSYVPQPYQVSKMIVGAHERNLKLHGN